MRQRVLRCLQDYGKVPTYMEKRSAEEREGLEAYCSRLQEEREEEIQRRLQKQQDALLVPSTLSNAANGFPIGLSSHADAFPPASPAGLKENLVSDRQRDQSHPDHYGEQFDPVPQAASGRGAAAGGKEHRIHKEMPGKAAKGLTSVYFISWMKTRCVFPLFFSPHSINFAEKSI